jgi:hypothetical protein
VHSVLKTVSGLWVRRGFKSLPLPLFMPNPIRGIEFGASGAAARGRPRWHRGPPGPPEAPRTGTRPARDRRAPALRRGLTGGVAVVPGQRQVDGQATSYLSLSAEDSDRARLSVALAALTSFVAGGAGRDRGPAAVAEPGTATGVPSFRLEPGRPRPGPPGLNSRRPVLGGVRVHHRRRRAAVVRPS